MRLPVLRGVIDRRILVNYRVDPQVLAATLPAPFRPKLHHGYGVVGICLIRLRGIRPRGLPAWLGASSENAAHRTAVEWDEGGQVREGVYIRRRDSSSRLNSLAGGRAFPGLQSHARFVVNESPHHLELSLRSDDGVTSLAVAGEVSRDWPEGSIFGSLAEASAFFQGGALGYSATADPSRFQGMELSCRRWQVEPLAVATVSSSYFDDRGVFPEGSIAFDCALLMRDIEHEWLGHADLCCAVEGPGSARPLAAAV